MANPRHQENASFLVGKPHWALGSRVFSTTAWKIKGVQHSSGDQRYGHPQKTIMVWEKGKYAGWSKESSSGDNIGLDITRKNREMAMPWPKYTVPPLE